MRPSGSAILLGLERFMPRLGHISVLLIAADEVGAYKNRITKRFAKLVTAPTPVQPDDQDIVKYLVTKGLCEMPSKEPKTRDEAKRSVRYSNVSAVKENGSYRLKLNGDDPLNIWWEDKCLAAPDIRSQVAP